MKIFLADRNIKFDGGDDRIEVTAYVLYPDHIRAIIQKADELDLVFYFDNRLHIITKEL